MSVRLRFNEYVKKLLKNRKKEMIHKNEKKSSDLNMEIGLPSPTSAVSSEETRILMEYMGQSNLFNLIAADQSKRKVLTLKKFFRMKRNQQVEVYTNHGDEVIYTEGKVTAIGRDFVTLSNLKHRIWIPFHSISSANTPYGYPNYSNSHQNYLYDNNLRKKLLLNFGETVARKDELIQQFCEESLQTNLQTWKNSWIEVRINESEKVSGKIIEVEKDELVMKTSKNDVRVPIGAIKYIQSLRLLQVTRNVVNRLEKWSPRHWKFRNGGEKIE